MHGQESQEGAVPPAALVSKSENGQVAERFGQLVCVSPTQEVQPQNVPIDLDEEEPKVSKSKNGQLAELFGQLPAEVQKQFLRQLGSMVRQPSQELDDHLEADLGELIPTQEASEETARDQLVPKQSQQQGSTKEASEETAGAQLVPAQAQQQALSQFFSLKRKLGPFQSLRSQASDKLVEKAEKASTPKKKGGRPRKPEWAKREKGRLPAGVRRLRTEPGAVQCLAYLERYRTLSETHQSKHKARQILMKELRCSETFIKNLEKREAKIKAKAENIGKHGLRKNGKSACV